MDAAEHVARGTAQFLGVEGARQVFQQAGVELVVLLGQLVQQRLEVGLDRVQGRHQGLADVGAAGHRHQMRVVRVRRQPLRPAALEVGRHQLALGHAAGCLVSLDGGQRGVIAVAGLAQEDHTQHGHALLAAGQLGVGAQLVGGCLQAGFDLGQVIQGAAAHEGCLDDAAILGHGTPGCHGRQ